MIGGYTEPEGSRKHLGALLVGLYEGTNLNLPAESEPFSEKLLRSLFDYLEKIRVESCPFSNLPAPAQPLGPRVNRRRNEALPLGKTVDGLPSHFTEWTRG